MDAEKKFPSPTSKMTETFRSRLLLEADLGGKCRVLFPPLILIGEVLPWELELIIYQRRMLLGTSEWRQYLSLMHRRQMGPWNAMHLPEYYNKLVESTCVESGWVSACFMSRGIIHLVGPR